MDRRKLGLSLAAGLTGWCALALAWPHLEPDDPDGLTILAYAATAAAFVAAGVTQVVRARVTGQRQLEWSSAALVVAGSAIVLVGGLQRLSATAAVGRYPAPAIRFLILVPALVLLAAGAHSPASQPRPTPRRLTIGLVGGYAALGLVLAVPGVSAAVHRTDHAPVWLAAGLLAIAGWVSLALRTAVRAQGPYAAWRALTFALIAASGISYAVGLYGGRRADEIAAGLMLAAAGVALAGAAGGLRLALASGSRRMLHLDADLDRSRRLLEQAEHREAERLHDARAAALGIEAAVTGLGDAELARLVSGEVGRLVGLLEPDAAEPVRAFSVRDTLAPVLDARRRAGLRVVAELGRHRAFGRPSATANALANLLANAAAHAPGASVRVRSFGAGHTVSIVVDDDGPGIPAPDRATIALRGTRGRHTAAPGSGLGLYTAAEAMAGQGGALHVDERPGGGTRVVLTLPADHQHHASARCAWAGRLGSRT